MKKVVLSLAIVAAMFVSCKENAAEADATVDTATALIELYSLVYAFDINVESPVKVQDLVGNILDEVSYDDEGIHFSNKSVKGSGLDIWMKYADLAE